MDTDPDPGSILGGLGDMLGGTETIETDLPGSSGGEREEETDTPAKAPRLFGGLTPAEAGLRSAQRRAERALAGETEVARSRSGETRTVRTSVETGSVIDKLARDAKSGNVQAARELRAWLSELPVEEDTDLSALDKRTRQQVLARVVAEIEADERALEGTHSGDTATQTIESAPQAEGEGSTSATAVLAREAGSPTGATPADEGLR